MVIPCPEQENAMETDDNDLMIDTPWGRKRWGLIRKTFESQESLLYACLHAETHADFTDSAWVHIPLESMDRIRDAISKARSF